MYEHLIFIMMIATCATLASCSNDDSEEYLSEQESQIGSATINGTTYGMCVKASNINRIFGLTRY